MEAQMDAIITLILQLAKQWRLLTIEISSRDEHIVYDQWKKASISTN